MKYLLLLILVFAGCAHHEPRSSSEMDIQIVEYYPGKNEICTNSEAETLELKIESIIIMSIVYTPTDKETYCTIVAEEKGPEGNKIERFSASFKKGPCEKLFKGQYKKVKVQVVQDHICKVL